MKKLIACTLLAATFNANAGMFSSDTDDAMDTVRSGVPGNCNHEIGEMVDAFFNDAEWEASKTKSGRLYVNIEGDVSISEKSQKAFMQFEVDDDEFWLNVLKLNNRRQSNMMMRSFANKMCDAVK